METLKYFDSHAHYNDERFLGDEINQPVGELLDTLFSTTVSGIVNAATDLETAQQCITLAERYPYMYAAAGIYPGDTARLDGQRDTVLSQLKGMLCHPKVVALGEIGLDFHYDDSPRAIQEKWFEAQLTLSVEADKPVVIHDREAHGRVMEILRNVPDARGIFHSYSGSDEMAKALIKPNINISISGSVTFKNAANLQKAAAYVPLERILIETDSPYLAPVPMRGRINHSGNLCYIAEAIAAIKGISAAAVARATDENARRVFGIRETDK